MLQTTTIFHNVGKGVVAKDKELQAAFGSTDQKTICLEILAKGELQVGLAASMCRPALDAAAGGGVLVGCKDECGAGDVRHVVCRTVYILARCQTPEKFFLIPRKQPAALVQHILARAAGNQLHCLGAQVSDKERKQEYEHVFKDVAGVLVEKCINPATQRPYTLSMLERALRDIHFNVDPKKSAKQQALEVRPY